MVAPVRTAGDPAWVPDRQEIIWINCSPHAGAEMRDPHPFLVLSPKNFNDRTSLVIGLPMTSAEYNADNPFALAVGKVRVGEQEKTSFVLCHQPKSFDWRQRRGSPHPLQHLDDQLFTEACALLNQIIRLSEF